jgi:hypothetical protein
LNTVPRVKKSGKAHLFLKNVTIQTKFLNIPIIENGNIEIGIQPSGFS